MSEAHQRGIMDAPGDSSIEFGTLIASLRTAGAGRFDPMRLHYIEVLSKRAATHHGRVRHLLDARLAQALAAFRERFDLARSDAQDTVARIMGKYPLAAHELQRLFAAGDFRGLRHFAARLEASEDCASLGSLVRQLERHALGNADTRSDEAAESRSELRAIRNFRTTWSKLSVDKQVSQALQQAPKNAGPINSHMLMLRSLTLMRDIAPDYLNHFMSYADALLCLDPGEKEKPGSPKKHRASKK